jgi:hypothetical protein
VDDDRFGVDSFLARLRAEREALERQERRDKEAHRTAMLEAREKFETELARMKERHALKTDMLKRKHESELLRLEQARVIEQLKEAVNAADSADD